jgi:hypothetical protein
VLVEVSCTIKRSIGETVAAAGLVFATVVTEKESADVARASARILRVPAVVESDLFPPAESDPVAAVVVKVN